MDTSGRGLRIAVLVVLVAAIAYLMWDMTRPEWEPIPVMGVVAESDSDEIAVVVLHSECRRGPRVVVEETDEVVRLQPEQDVSAGCDDVGITSQIDVELDAPLGDRTLELVRWAGAAGVADPTCEVDGQPDDRCVAVPSEP